MGQKWSSQNLSGTLENSIGEYLLRVAFNSLRAQFAQCVGCYQLNCFYIPCRYIFLQFWFKTRFVSTKFYNLYVKMVQN